MARFERRFAWEVTVTMSEQNKKLVRELVENIYGRELTRV